MTIDLEPAARGIAASVAALRDDQLGAPTPCPAYSVGDLVEHIGGLAIAFAGAATKASGPTVSQAPAGDAARLGADWQSRIPADLLTMAAAWRVGRARSRLVSAIATKRPRRYITAIISL